MPSAIGRLARMKTREQFAGELAKYTSLSAKEVERLFPKKKDQKELIELMKIVNSASDDNAKKSELTRRIGTVGGAVIKIAKRFATGIA